jgi:hypothetical protein
MGFEKVCGLEKALFSAICLLETIWQNSWNAGQQRSLLKGDYYVGAPADLKQ